MGPIEGGQQALNVTPCGAVTVEPGAANAATRSSPSSHDIHVVTTAPDVSNTSVPVALYGRLLRVNLSMPSFLLLPLLLP